MKAKYTAAVFGIFICTVVAWVGLGTSITYRTYTKYDRLAARVQELWGSPHSQTAPEIYYLTYKKVKKEAGKKTWFETVSEKHNFEPQSSDIKVNLDLNYRKKGLLWYSTYKVDFTSKYSIKNSTDKPQTIYIHFNFPATQALYDDFNFAVDHKRFEAQGDLTAGITATTDLAPNQTKEFQISYKSQGLDDWAYKFGAGVTRVQNFTLVANTNFKNIDFPPGTISPSEKSPTTRGWQLTWKYKNLIAGFCIGIEMPKKLNPGPLASRISYFAPLPLFLFFFVLIILGGIKNISIHPMNYFFLAAAFFAFHILFAYLVDHIDINLAFLISAVVSVALVVSYLRLVVNLKFALKEAGLSQLLFLILFSYAFFYPGYTGLLIVIGAIITLAALMQITGRVKWEEKTGS